MNNKAKSCILLLLGALFLGLFTQLASAYNQPYYSPYYNNQYYYRYNYQYNYESYPGFNQQFFSGHYGYGIKYAAMPSYQCNSIYGCRTTYNSYIHLGDALDYTYYTHPELLAPRYMENHMRYVKGLWPQKFWY